MTLFRTARVFTDLGENVLNFLSLDGTDAMGQPFEYEVDLLSTDEQLDFTKVLGHPMLVTLDLPNNQLREFSGYVTRFVLVGSLGRYVRYRATLRPWLWLMTRRSNCRIFQKQTVPDVVKAMFREHGFSDFEDKLSPGYRQWEYLVQYRESDFNFVSRMMEQEGIYYYFRHAKGKHTLVLSDAYSAHKTVPGYEVIRYIPRTQDHTIEDNIDTWRAVHQITSGAFKADDYDFERPKAKVGSTLKPGTDYQYGDFEIYDYPGEFADAAQADTQVKLRLQAELAQHDIVRGEGNARGIHAGALMSMLEFPRADQNKEYLVVTTSISLRGEHYESLLDTTSAPEEPSFRVSFSAIDAKRAFRVARTTHKPVVRGPQTAVVVGQSGQEIWTDKYGRVKVQFRWDRRQGFDEDSSCWVRVAQLWAGSGWGGVHTPRIGQEVIVDFLEGNPDRPVITGRLYNADNMPPYDPSKTPTQSGIRSHSTKGGGKDNFNEIYFEDKIGEEGLNVQAEKDMTILVKHDRTTTILRNDTLNITGDQFIKIHGNLSMTVEGVTEKDNPDKAKPVKSSLGVTGAHRIDASDTIDVQAPNKITFTCGSSTITMTPDRIVMHAGGGTEIAMDTNGRFESSQHSKLFLDPNACLEASGHAKLLLDPNANLTSSHGDQVLLDGSVKISSPADVSMSGVNVSSSGSSTAGIGVGGASVVASKASVDVGGPAINVSGDGQVNVAGGIVKVG